MKGILRARYAILVDKFHLTLDQIAGLTERQIQEVYFHPRDNDGKIILPELPIDETDVVPKSKREALLMKIDIAKANKMIDAKRYEELKRQIDEKYPPEE